MVKNKYQTQQDSRYLLNELKKMASGVLNGSSLNDVDIERAATDALLMKVLVAYPEKALDVGFLVTDRQDSKLSQDAASFIETLETYQVLPFFSEASIFARKYGVTYLYVNTTDGDWSQPLTPNSRFLGFEVFLPNQCRFELETNLYRVGSDLIHPSRIYLFYGYKKYKAKHQPMDNYGSCLDWVYPAWQLFNCAPDYIFKLLKTSNQIILGVQGLGAMVRQDLATNSTSGRDLLISTASTINETRDLFNLVVKDLDRESFENLTAEFRGAESLYEVLKDNLCIRANMPRSWLFEDFETSKLGTGQSMQLIERYREAKRIKVWMTEHWTPLIKRFQNQFFNPRLKVQPNFLVELTQFEKAELETLIANRNKTLVETGIISIEEARLSYATDELNLNVTLKEELNTEPTTQNPTEDSLEITNAPNQKMLEDIDRVNWTDLVSVKASDFDKLAENIIAE